MSIPAAWCSATRLSVGLLMYWSSSVRNWVNCAAPRDDTFLRFAIEAPFVVFYVINCRCLRARIRLGGHDVLLVALWKRLSSFLQPKGMKHGQCQWARLMQHHVVLRRLPNLCELSFTTLTQIVDSALSSREEESGSGSRNSSSHHWVGTRRSEQPCTPTSTAPNRGRR